jgi:hypothetical protein
MRERSFIEIRQGILGVIQNIEGLAVPGNEGCSSRHNVGDAIYITFSGLRWSYSDIRRGLNAYRDPETFQRAMQKLQKIGAIRVTKQAGTRRRWVMLVEVPKCFRETRLRPKPRRHPRRSRGQTPWFKRLIAELEARD